MTNQKALRRWAAAAGLAAIVLIALLPGPAAARQQPAKKAVAKATSVPTIAGYKTIWKDSFNGPSGHVESRWLYDTGTGYACQGCPNHWGTDEIEYMSTSTNNVAQNGGQLLITPVKHTDG